MQAKVDPTIGATRSRANWKTSPGRSAVRNAWAISRTAISSRTPTPPPSSRIDWRRSPAVKEVIPTGRQGKAVRGGGLEAVGRRDGGMGNVLTPTGVNAAFEIHRGSRMRRKQRDTSDDGVTAV